MSHSSLLENGSQGFPLARLDSPSKQELLLRMSNIRQPFVFTGKTGHWAARSWTPEYFAKAMGDTIVEPLVDLPRHGMPYFWNDRNYGRSMPLAELVEKMSADPGSQCYLAQKSIDSFPRLNADFDFGEITPGFRGRATATSFWMGSGGTHSGFHFDRRDNVFVQIYGHKKVILAAPEEARNLYPIHDMFEKSSVDPVIPDLSRHPKFALAKLHHVDVAPGDVLFIPRLWWHYLESRDTSISLNHWYGDECSLSELARMMSAGGVAVVATALRDAFWHGVCRRPYRTRLRSDMPSGVFVYQVISGGIKRRLRVGAAP